MASFGGSFKVSASVHAITSTNGATLYTVPAGCYLLFTASVSASAGTSFIVVDGQNALSATSAATVYQSGIAAGPGAAILFAGTGSGSIVGTLFANA